MKSNAEIEIRHARGNDKEFWFSLDKHISANQFDKKVKDKQGFILFADGQPAGILRYNLFWDNTPFCTLLYIKKEYQRQGYGKALMTFWEREMQLLGYCWLLVSTQVDEDAQHFYRALGYYDCGSLNAPNQPPELFLGKRLFKIVYEKLSIGKITPYFLDNFQRLQEVYKCWRKIDGEFKLIAVRYTEDWNLSERRKLAEKVLAGISRSDIAYGAIMEGEIIGFAFLDSALFGSKNQYVDLAEFYVSAPYRRMGIGKKLFGMACAGAKELGATKLYISAHSAEDSIAAYHSYGCIYAEEINRELAEKEPCDLQLEYSLY